MSPIEEMERQAKRKPVEVIVFEEPSKKSRLQRQSSDVSKGSTKRENSPNEQDFKSIFEDVRSLGVTGFSKKERKKMEEQKMQSLGARKQKGQKVPYPILQQVIKKKQEKEKERQEMEKAMGIFTKKKKSSKTSKDKTSLGWWSDKPVNIDKTSNNLTIRKSDMKAIKKKIRH